MDDYEREVGVLRWRMKIKIIYDRPKKKSYMSTL